MNNLQQEFLEAGTLMLVGMVVVFAFLGLLILFINLVLAKFAVRFPDAVVPSRAPSNRKNNNKKAVDGEVSPAIVAAISGAVNRYRAQHGKSDASAKNSLPQNKN